MINSSGIRPLEGAGLQYRSLIIFDPVRVRDSGTDDLHRKILNLM